MPAPADIVNSRDGASVVPAVFLRHDQVSRAYGVLKTAHTITSEETMLLLSLLRMGINLGLIDDLDIPTVNELFIHTQPAHLQKLQGSPLGADERNIARATYLRNRLGRGKPE